MTLSTVEELLESTDHNGFPVVVSMESQYLVGFVLRRDLSLAINNAKSRMEGISGETLVLFTNQVSISNTLMKFVVLLTDTCIFVGSIGSWRKPCWSSSKTLEDSRPGPHNYH